MNDHSPTIRRDLELFPINHGGQQVILIRDHLGLVQEGKAIGLPLYQFLAQLDGTKTKRDLQMDLMRQRGGVIVGMDEVENLLQGLDASYLLDSERFREASARIVADFSSMLVRPCSHCGKAYPGTPHELKNRLDEILKDSQPGKTPDNMLRALVAPHIDLTVGHRVYASAYRMMESVKPDRVIVLGVGHRLGSDLFSVTDKDFETPVGTIRGDHICVRELRDAGGDLIAANDFAHRSEHSIEFQAIFIRHLLQDHKFTMIPVLCGSFQTSLSEYSRDSFIEKAGPFLLKLEEILSDTHHKTLLIAGVDLSHVGPKFGHEIPAQQIINQSEAHDKRLLEYLTAFDADGFWEESGRVKDQFNVCGFSALACLLEVLPKCDGEILDYEIWHEEPTRSAVSFAAVAFT
ncbi:AmmeMemoRadiSam system protein B [Thermodesulfobacteriota bacterium]